MKSSLILVLLHSLHTAAQLLKQIRVETWHDSEERWHDDDLVSFVTRPDIRPPKWRIVQQKRDLMEPGYLFIGPYASFNRPSANSMWMPHQIGPHIYDQDGELIWSGGHIYPGRAVFDFKVAMYHDEPHLTFAVGMGPEHTAASQGLRLVLNSSYHIVANYTPSGGIHENLHEFTVLGNGKSALCVEHYTAPDEKLAGSADDRGLLVGQSIVEFDMRTGNKLFEWESQQHVSSTESSFSNRLDNAEGSTHWDYLHMNSIDKAPSGDYLISARHTDTIYFISATSGDILWRLGGLNSSFRLEGFDFSQSSRFLRQHDARVRSQNSTTMVISLFNNACDEETVDDDDEPSSLLDLALYTTESPMVAKVIRRVPRPDRRRTFARGNYQHLPGGNVLGGWSDDGYVTEHTSSGQVVYEASFESSRFGTYRTYKLPWVGRPLEKPVLKAFASATRHQQLTTILHVSWNGATEVVRWNFYSADHGIYDVRALGGTKRSGFETSFIVKGHYAIVFAEAVDKDGLSLSNSTLTRTELPASWHITDFNDDHDQDSPNLESSRDLDDSKGRIEILGLIALAAIVLLSTRRLALQRMFRRLVTSFRRNEAASEGIEASFMTKATTSSVAQGTVLQR